MHKILLFLFLFNTYTAHSKQRQYKLLAVRVDFKDAKLECNSRDIREKLFGNKSSLKNLVLESSYGKLRVVGDIQSVTIEATTSPVNRNLWKSLIYAELDKMNYDYSQFDGFQFFHPNKGEAALGLAGNILSWVKNCKSPGGLFTHEFGHLLGFVHSYHLDNKKDETTTMGRGGLFPYSAPRRHLKKWLDEDTIDYFSVGENRNVSLVPLHKDDDINVAIIRADSKKPDWRYYVSYRSHSPLFPLRAGFNHKVHIVLDKGPRVATVFIAALDKFEDLEFSYPGTDHKFYIRVLNATKKGVNVNIKTSRNIYTNLN